MFVVLGFLVIWGFLTAARRGERHSKVARGRFFFGDYANANCYADDEI